MGEIIEKNVRGEKAEDQVPQAVQDVQPAIPCLPVPHRENGDLATMRLRQRLRASTPQPSLTGS